MGKSKGIFDKFDGENISFHNVKKCFKNYSFDSSKLITKIIYGVTRLTIIYPNIPRGGKKI